ncbi:hypothetical protein D3C85_1204550 [compost metagenome]
MAFGAAGEGAQVGAGLAFGDRQGDALAAIEHRRDQVGGQFRGAGLQGLEAHKVRTQAHGDALGTAAGQFLDQDRQALWIVR